MESFHSTRSAESHLTSKQAILKGIADDGGLFVNDSLAGHHIDASALAGKSYADI
ncbi:MAG: threonine synthase, partial [Scardovia wiggsiae]